MIIYTIILVAFFTLMLIFFRIANHYNIVDHPNERSSHQERTIRGGGVIFIFAAVIAVIMHPEYWVPITGLFVIGIISFIDDLFTLSNTIRILMHLAAVSLLFIYINAFSLPIYEWLILYFIVIGTINAYNFMDGINGITGAYSLVVLCGIQYVNLYRVNFVNEDMIWLPMLACCVFLFFNYRKKAKCFAGDVGSVTIASWIVMLLIKLVLITDNWSYVLFLAVYGTDSVATIVHRISLKQDVFKAHRFHLYQIMVNEQKFSHLKVALGYALLQAIIISFVIIYPSQETFVSFTLILLPLLLIYILLKSIFMKKITIK